LSQERLAAMANVSRNRLAALLRELRAQGLVRLSYAAMTPIQPQLLRAIVNGDRPFRLPRGRG
jgi:DNA-binding transcriptional regulator LsrR (DeoR family)